MTDVLIAVLATLALTQAAVLATSVYLHRALTHRSLVVHPVAEVMFRSLLWLTTGQRRREWVAVHRKHHTFTDRDGDPHSPRLVGLAHVFLFNVRYYMREARNPHTLATFAPDIADDRLERFVFAWGWAGPALGIGLLCLIFGVPIGLAIALAHAVLYVFVIAPLINGVGHWRGRQTFDNTARNSRVLAWVTGGESLHNNHHAYPRAAKFSMQRAEFDPSWPLIRALVAMRMVTVVGARVRVPAGGNAVASRPSVVEIEGV
jgi:stearoyl-CoA desaturase (delta-9 desaturase)